MRPTAAMLLVVLCLGGCEPPAGSDWTGTVIDSAGIRIVQNPAAPLWTAEEGWWVEEALRIAPREDVPETGFGYVVDVTMDGEGRVYALDRQARAVRAFDADGNALGTLGGPGEGPGGLG
ncbi:MAG: hypothetical protein P8188_17850, partial [Gemmatimonadota bacterium]